MDKSFSELVKLKNIEALKNYNFDEELKKNYRGLNVLGFFDNEEKINIFYQLCDKNINTLYELYKLLLPEYNKEVRLEAYFWWIEILKTIEFKNHIEPELLKTVPNTLEYYTEKNNIIHFQFDNIYVKNSLLKYIKKNNDFLLIYIILEKMKEFNIENKITIALLEYVNTNSEHYLKNFNNNKIDLNFIIKHEILLNKTGLMEKIFLANYEQNDYGATKIEKDFFYLNFYFNNKNKFDSIKQIEIELYFLEKINKIYKLKEKIDNSNIKKEFLSLLEKFNPEMLVNYSNIVPLLLDNQEILNNYIKLNNQKKFFDWFIYYGNILKDKKQIFKKLIFDQESLLEFICYLSYLKKNDLNEFEIFKDIKEILQTKIEEQNYSFNFIKDSCARPQVAFDFLLEEKLNINVGLLNIKNLNLRFFDSKNKFHYRFVYNYFQKKMIDLIKNKKPIEPLLVEFKKKMFNELNKAELKKFIEDLEKRLIPYGKEYQEKLSFLKEEIEQKLNLSMKP